MKGTAAVTIALVNSFLAVFVLLPLGIFQGYLMYQHVKATDLMWFLFWFNSSLSVLISISLKIVEIILKKAEE